MFKSLKTFLLRGEVLALAVGVVVGGAFNNIITTLVDKLFAPLIGAATGGVDFSTAAFTVAGIEIGWGAIVQVSINFLIVGLALFLFLRLLGQDPNAPPPPTPTEEYLKEIRDLLKAQQQR